MEYKCLNAHTVVLLESQYRNYCQGCATTYGTHTVLLDYVFIGGNHIYVSLNESCRTIIQTDF